MIARGVVTRAFVSGGRVLLDVTLLSGETRSRVEMMQGFGVTAIPTPGTEVLVQQMQARGHLVVVQADAPGLRVTDAGAGGVALADAHGNSVILRAGEVKVTAATKVVIVSAGAVEIEAASATLTSAGAVVVDAPSVKLGSAGATKRVKLEDNSNATKVFAE